MVTNKKKKRKHCWRHEWKLVAINRTALATWLNWDVSAQQPQKKEWSCCHYQLWHQPLLPTYHLQHHPYSCHCCCCCWRCCWRCRLRIFRLPLQSTDNVLVLCLVSYRILYYQPSSCWLCGIIIIFHQHHHHHHPKRKVFLAMSMLLANAVAVSVVAEICKIAAVEK